MRGKGSFKVCHLSFKKKKVNEAKKRITKKKGRKRVCEVEECCAAAVSHANSPTLTPHCR